MTNDNRLVDRFEDFAELAINLFCVFVACKLIWLFVEFIVPGLR